MNKPSTCLSKKLADYFNGGYRNLSGDISIVSQLSKEEKKLIRELLANLSINIESRSFNFDEIVNVSLKLMITSLQPVHPLLAKVFRKMCVPYLPDYEKNVKEILTSHQDHIVHSANLYILGLYLTDQLKVFKNDHINSIRNDLIFAERDDAIFGTVDQREFNSYKRPSFALKEFLQRWKITAFFHDTAYPAEISSKLMEHWFEDILDQEKPVDSPKLVTYRLNVLDKYFKLKIPQNPSWPFPNLSRVETDIFFIFSYRLAVSFFQDLRVETIRDILYENFYNLTLNKGFVEHGFFSALIFTYMLHHEVEREAEKFSKQTRYCAGKRKEFHSTRYELTSLYLRSIDAATAILLHNLQNFKHHAFNDKKIKSRECPLAFLLKLCDELQTWNRYKGDFDKNITHKKLESLKEAVDNDLYEIDSLGKYPKKRYLDLTLEEQTFCFDAHGNIKINKHKVKDKIVRKILYKLFTISSYKEKGKFVKVIKDIEDFVDKELDKEFEHNKKDQCDLKISQPGKKHFALIKENRGKTDSTLLLAAVIYKLFLSESENLDDDRVNLNKWVESMEHVKLFIETCLKEFYSRKDKVYGSDNYYLEIENKTESKNVTRIYIDYPDRSDALKKAAIINKVLELSNNKEDLVTVVTGKKKLTGEQDFLFTLLEKMIRYKKENLKMEETHARQQ